MEGAIKVYKSRNNETEESSSPTRHHDSRKGSASVRIALRPNDRGKWSRRWGDGAMSWPKPPKVKVADTWPSLGKGRPIIKWDTSTTFGAKDEGV